MAGIEDLMNIRTQGGTENAPPAGPPMGGPPMGGPSMVPPPGMGGPKMAADEPRMDPMDVDGGMSIEGDATALAQAVVGRTDGDIASAREVLAKADMILAQADNRRPQMAKDGGELKAVPDDAIGLSKLPETVRNRMGYMNMGGPLYAAEGRAISDRDTDMLRQMIMDSLANEDQSSRAASDKDATKFINTTTKLIDSLDQGQSGRAMSDKDREIALESMRNYRRN